MPINKLGEYMDFSKINGELKPKEVTPKVIKKPQEASVSFSEVLQAPKKTYTLPSLGETSVFSGSDSATISESSKAAYYLSKIMNIVKDIPDVREAKIERALKLLKEGINSPRINKEITERILHIFLND